MVIDSVVVLIIIIIYLRGEILWYTYNNDDDIEHT